MSIEFRLKYIRDVIDKNINEVLLKWNAKKVLLNEPFDEEIKEMCLACLETGEQRFLKYFYVNMDEAVYKCESSACLFPFRNFKYKNFTDRTIFRYERTVTTDASKTEHKMFSSATKEENVDLGEDFNLSWLDQSFDTESDLDAILTSPSEGTLCDIKEIINDICNNVDTSSLSYNSPSNRHQNFEQSPKVPAAKLSKCLKYIERLLPLPSKRPISTKMEVMTPSWNTSTHSESTPMLSKSRKKTRKVEKKSRETKSVKFQNVDQRPIGSLDWLSLVSKIEPENIQQFEFAYPTQVNEDRKNYLPKNIKHQSEQSNTQPILIEFIGTSASYVLDGNQLSTDGELCLSHQQGQSQKTQNAIDRKSDLRNAITLPAKKDSSSKPISTIISSTNTLPSDTTSNAKHSTNIKIERLHSDISVNKTEPETGKVPLKQDYGTFEHQHQQQTETPMLENKTGEIKLEQTKNEIKMKISSLQLNVNEQQKIEKIKKDQRRRDKIKQKKLMVRENKKMELNTNRKSFNIEVEEIFRGFEPLEPFKPISLQRKSLMWLKTE